MKNLCIPIRIGIHTKSAGARGAFNALLSSSEGDAGEAVLAGENQQGRLTLCCILQGQSMGSTARGANAEIRPADSSLSPFLFAPPADLQLVLEGCIVPVLKLSTIQCWVSLVHCLASENFLLLSPRTVSCHILFGYPFPLHGVVMLQLVL